MLKIVACLFQAGDGCISGGILGMYYFQKE